MHKRCGNGVDGSDGQARRAIFGEGAALTPDRFLFGNVGEVHLIRWSPEHGHRARTTHSGTEFAIMLSLLYMLLACTAVARERMATYGAWHVQRLILRMLNTLSWSLQVLPLAPASAEEALKLAVAEVMASPAAALQALYDHAHGSYSQVLPSGSVMGCIIAKLD